MEEDICQTCLSIDRFMYPLIESEAFLKEINVEIKAKDGNVCWECRRLIKKAAQFRAQALNAQRLIHNCDKLENLKSLSKLTVGDKFFHYTHSDPVTNTNISFTETGPILIKQEVTETAEDDQRDDTENQDNPISEARNAEKNPPYSQNSVNNPCEVVNLVPGNDLHILSDLPRITSVESITDQTNETNRQTQHVTEIIELNIPVHHPILVQDEGIDSHSVTLQNRTTETHSVVLHGRTTEDESDVSQDGTTEDHYYVSQYRPTDDHSYVLQSRTPEAHCYVSQDQTTQNQSVAVSQNEKSILRSDLHTVVPQNRTTNINIISPQARIPEIHSEISQNKTTSQPIILQNGTTNSPPVVSQSGISKVQFVPQNRTEKIRTEQNRIEKRTNENCQADVRDSASNVIGNKKKPIDESITVKVAYKGHIDANGIETKIKEEPASDSDDVQFEAEYTIEATRFDEESEEIKCDPDMEAKRKHETWKRSVLLVYDRLSCHKYASRFHRPITDDMAPGYSEVVKRPMSLSTIRKNIISGGIKTTAEFQRDILLMLSNALMYNNSDHCVYHMAKDLLDEAQFQLGLLLTVHANVDLPDTTRIPRLRRHLATDAKQPPAKRPRMSTVTPKVEKSTDITPKVEKVSKVTPKIESSTPKKKRTNRTPKVQEPTTSAPKAIVNPFSIAELNLRNLKVEICDLKNDIEINMPTLRRSQRIPKLTPKAAMALTPKVEKKSTQTPKTEKTPMVALVTPKVEKKSSRTPKSEETPRVGKKRGPKPKSVNPVIVPKVEKDLIVAPKVEKETKTKSQKHKDVDEACSSKTLNDELAVAITLEPQRDLTREEAGLLKKILENAILSMAMVSSNFTPKFRGEPIIADGVVKLWCDDRQSVKWLENIVSKLPRKMGKLYISVGRFVVKKQSELPKKVKSAILIPGCDAELAVIQKLLKAQNPWALVDSWAIYSAEQRGESMFLVLGIPTTVIPLLLGRQRRLAYSLGSVYVRFYNLGGKLCDSPPGSV